MCFFCYGVGQVIVDLCLLCCGEGCVDKVKMLLVNILVGVDEGMCICLMGEGEVGVCGVFVGDFYIFLYVICYVIFECEGMILFCCVLISFMMVVLGGSIEILGFDQECYEICIFVGIQLGKQFCQCGVGMFVFNGCGMGDLVVQVEVEILIKLIVK